MQMFEFSVFVIAEIKHMDHYNGSWSHCWICSKYWSYISKNARVTKIFSLLRRIPKALADTKSVFSSKNLISRSLKTVRSLSD